MQLGETSQQAKALRAVKALSEVRVLPFDDPAEVAALEAEGRRRSLTISAFTCYDNSLVLAQMKQAQAGEVRVVGGVGVRHFDDHSIAVQSHAWVRIGQRHLDCTWSRWGTTDGFAYFSMFELSDFAQVDARQLREKIEGGARRLGIRLEE